MTPMFNGYEIKNYKWFSHYTLLIEKAQITLISPGTYTETHHIIPKSLGGSDEPSNLVKLTARQHFIAHLLLAKSIMSNKMICALHKMVYSNKTQRVTKFTSHIYKFLREEHAKTVSSYSRETVTCRLKGTNDKYKRIPKTEFDSNKHIYESPNSGKKVSKEVLLKREYSRQPFEITFQGLKIDLPLKVAYQLYTKTWNINDSKRKNLTVDQLRVLNKRFGFDHIKISQDAVKFVYDNVIVMLKHEWSVEDMITLCTRKRIISTDSSNRSAETRSTVIWRTPNGDYTRAASMLKQFPWIKLYHTDAIRKNSKISRKFEILEYRGVRWNDLGFFAIPKK